MFQLNKQHKTSEKELNELEVSNLPGKMFKVMVVNSHQTQEKNG